MSNGLREAILEQKPTSEQEEAIFADEREFLLRAAPGSGKTWTSCRRFVWRAGNWDYQVGGLALLSFTNVAITEFREAASELGRSDLLADPNYVGTFDSFIERFLISPFGHLLKGSQKRPRLFVGPRPGDRKNKKLKVWIAGRGEKRMPLQAWDIVPTSTGGELSSVALSTFGVTDTGPHGLPVIDAFLEYGYYTHAQRPYWAFRLLRSRPHLARAVSSRFPEIIVDEAQDTNQWLLAVLGELRKNGSKITLVGDPDQCIYEFSMASASSLKELQQAWGIEEKPLRRSFRCNDRIAKAARSVVESDGFDGCGKPKNEWCRAYVVREETDGFDAGISSLMELTRRGNLDSADAAIVGRGHGQLDKVRGNVNYGMLQGKTKQIARAAFLRDEYRDFQAATDIVEKVLREITGDDDLWDRIADAPEAAEARELKLLIWNFVRDPQALPRLMTLGTDWVDGVKGSLMALIDDMGITVPVKIGNHIKRTGLQKQQLALPLIDANGDLGTIRQDTIHKVKGESIDSVLIIGVTKFWNAVVRGVCVGEDSEERRLAYVAMTRARHQLIVSLPKNHYDAYARTWESWGFIPFQPGSTGCPKCS